MTFATTGFAGFRPAAFAFFSELQDNNDPAWFRPRKAVYETEVLAPFRDLIIAATARVLPSSNGATRTSPAATSRRVPVT